MTHLAPSRHRTNKRTKRNGSLYLVVLGVGMIVGVAALTASAVGRLALRSAAEASDRRTAAVLAQSGVEFALLWLNENPSWRSTLSSGAQRGPILPDSTAEGSFTWGVTDVDGDLADDARDHAVLRSVGMMNDARVVLEVGIEPAGRSVTCLEAAIYSDTLITVKDSAEVSGAGVLHANGNIELTTATCNVDAEAVGACTGSTFTGPTADGVPAHETPGEHVFDYYLNRGTEIAIGDLPVSGGFRLIYDRLISRSLNPFGETNPWGIYWIDCQGEDVEILYSRILGTLVLMNAGPDTKVSDVSLIQAEAMNYPCLMVEGDLKIDLYTDGVPLLGIAASPYLYETLGVNRNPPGIPYDDGGFFPSTDTDSDISDNPLATIDGIIYVTGKARLIDDCVLRGALIANDVNVRKNSVVTLEYRPFAMNYPPPGFSAGPGVRVLPGTWRRSGM